MSMRSEVKAEPLSLRKIIGTPKNGYHRVTMAWAAWRVDVDSTGTNKVSFDTSSTMVSMASQPVAAATSASRILWSISTRRKRCTA